MVTHTFIFNNGKEILVRRALKGFGELEVEKFSPVERERYCIQVSVMIKPEHFLLM